MSATYQTIGITVERTKMPTDDAARAIIRANIPAILEQEFYIDDTESFVSMREDAQAVAEGMANDSAEEIFEDSLVEFLLEGHKFLRDSPDVGVYNVPGAPASFLFIVTGGFTHGDPILEEEASMYAVGNAAHYLPKLGQALGILGGGIRTGYGLGAGATG